ncbi:MAG: SMC-Scp complex subunit ScpB [Candidatus Margulisbacteria bacterium]|nr:SMC-Scp complex subunit ScpB [Candidatus Margulisiibacteriota bacterium]
MPEPVLLSSSRLKNILESLLYVARQPLKPDEVSKITHLSPAEVTAGFEELAVEYSGHGIQVVRVAGGYLMGTNAENVEYVHNLVNAKDQTSLSAQSLETLAIIAYKQPITRAEIERIRGVNSDGPLDSLLAKKLICDLGRSPQVGRPFLYGTTKEFLRHFGLKDLSFLPPLPDTQAGQDALFKTALHEQH